MARMEHRPANKQRIRRYSSLKTSILTILTSPVTLQLSFIPSDYCTILLWWVFFVTLDGLRPSDGLWYGQEYRQANNQGIASPLL